MESINTHLRPPMKNYSFKTMPNRKKPRAPKLPSREKAAFRKTRAWQDFRQEMIGANDYACHICGMRYEDRPQTLTVHHRIKCTTMEQYANLDPARFWLLCRPCHDWIHLKFNAPNLLKYKFFVPEGGLDDNPENENI